MELIVTASPNNEISIGLQSMGVRAKKAGDNHQDNIKTRMASHYGNAQIIAYQVGRFYAIENSCDVKGIKLTSRREFIQAQEAQSRSLDIIHEIQAKKIEDKNNAKRTKKTRVGYGVLGRVTKFTRLARHRILCAGNIIGRASKTPSESTFVTLTVPGNTASVASHIASWASYLVNSVLQVVRDADRREGETPCSWFYVWENQKRGVLHLHLVIHHEKPGRSHRLGTDVTRNWWQKLKNINELCEYALFSRRGGKECVLPKYWQGDVQPVRKCVASYVSKYVSKEGVNSASKGNKSKGFAPPRWWGMARNLVRAIDSLSSKVSIEGLPESIATRVYLEVRQLLSNPDVLVVVHSYSFDVSHGSYHVGSGFRDKFYLKPESYDSLSSLLGVFIRAALHRAFELEGVEPSTYLTGRNWLYKDAKLVTTISNRAMMRWYE